MECYTCKQRSVSSEDTVLLLNDCGGCQGGRVSVVRRQTYRISSYPFGELLMTSFYLRANLLSPLSYMFSVSVYTTQLFFLPFLALSYFTVSIDNTSFPNFWFSQIPKLQACIILIHAKNGKRRKTLCFSYKYRKIVSNIM